MKKCIGGSDEKKLMILVGLFMMFQFGYSLRCAYPYYKIENKDVIYNNYGKIIELKKVDLETFKKLDNTLGIDKNNVYYRGKIIKNVDAESFEIVSWYKPVATHPFWGVGCKVPYIESFKDKNGTYELKDIQNGKLQLEG